MSTKAKPKPEPKPGAKSGAKPGAKSGAARAARARPKEALQPAPPKVSDGDEEKWHLRLYVAGATPRSVAALSNLKKMCEEHLAGRYSIEVIDLLKQPQLAAGDQIFAIPTLVRKLPEPMKRIIGDLSNMERSLVGLDLRKTGTAAGDGAGTGTGTGIGTGTGA